jgi:hypothetical protein
MRGRTARTARAGRSGSDRLGHSPGDSARRSNAETAPRRPGVVDTSRRATRHELRAGVGTQRPGDRQRPA